MNPYITLWTIFLTVVIGFLVVDLGILQKHAHAVSFPSAVKQSIFWVVISLIFGTLVYFMLGAGPASEYLSAYITEKMLSVDNLFVILLLFRYFKLETKYYHRVLYWGILGAVLLRGVFIGAGSVLVSQFHWILYFFGALLVWTGIKIFKGGDEDNETDFEKTRVARLARKYLPFTGFPHKGDFMHMIKRQNGKCVYQFTTLFLILLLVEATDIIFAIDSIPAAFSITQNAFLLFTSNMFAVMGLRALFFLVENVIDKFKQLEKGIAVVLIFIGGKMLADIFGFHMSSVASLLMILVILGGSLLFSMIFKKYENSNM